MQSIRMTCLLLSILLFLIACNVVPVSIATLAPSPSKTPSPALTPSPTKPPCKIAFYSIRNGNGDIYIMEDDGSNLLRLTEEDSFDTSTSTS
jgi:Tol biopolymer transport system component